MIRSEAELALRREVEKNLIGQGYRIKNDLIHFNEKDRKEIRGLHKISRAERIKENIDFIQSFMPDAVAHIRDRSDIEISKIAPRLIEVKPKSKESRLFRWWNLAWWSLPHEKAYGRQMRFIVWDDHHDSPIGLIGLQSPLLSWSVRDARLGITPEKRDYWVNQSLSAQRLGALPPYNECLCGKLVALLMMSDEVRNAFKKKYHKRKTLLLNRTLPANLLFITTTGAYGKSSVYNRLKFNDEKLCEFIGHTSGHGTFHISNTLYESFISYLKDKDYKAARSYGNGPSMKMKNIDQVLKLLGFKQGCEHGIKRAVYLFPFVKNLESLVKEEKKRPVWYRRSVDELTSYWKERWAPKREKEGENPFRRGKYLKELTADLINCENHFK